MGRGMNMKTKDKTVADVMEIILNDIQADLDSGKPFDEKHLINLRMLQAQAKQIENDLLIVLRSKCIP